MPIYEYVCQDCQETTEFLIGVNQAKLDLKCRKCSGKKMKKKISSGYVSSGAKSKQEFCAQKGPCSIPSCMQTGMCGGGCH